MADEPEAAPFVPAEKPAPVRDGVEAAIAEWLAEHIHNSPAARSTDAFNHLVSVLPHLKAKLAKEA